MTTYYCTEEDCGWHGDSPDHLTMYVNMELPVCPVCQGTLDIYDAGEEVSR